MAIRASLYLKGELQKEMQKRPNGVSDQLERLFDCYKYCRRQLEQKFEEAELDLLLYAQKYGEWDDDPKAHYGLSVAVKKALDDFLDACEPNGAAKMVAQKHEDELIDELLAIPAPSSDDPESIRVEISRMEDESIRKYTNAIKALAPRLNAVRQVLNDTIANTTPFSDERLAEIRVWAEGIENLQGNGFLEISNNCRFGSNAADHVMISKLNELHAFELLTLVDALEQANKTENPQRTIRYLLPYWREWSPEAVRTE